MRFISPLRFLHPRVAQALVMGGVITAVGCKDSTAPRKMEAPQALALGVTQSADDELGRLSASLDDMTGWSLASLTDDQKRTNIVGILNGLKGHLKGGKIDASRQDVTDARAFLESLDEQKRVELGAVAITLDLIQSALDSASQ